MHGVSKKLNLKWRHDYMNKIYVIHYQELKNEILHLITESNDQINDIKIIIGSLQTNSKLWHAYCWIIKKLIIRLRFSNIEFTLTYLIHALWFKKEHLIFNEIYYHRCHLRSKLHQNESFFQERNVLSKWDTPKNHLIYD